MQEDVANGIIKDNREPACCLYKTQQKATSVFHPQRKDIWDYLIPCKSSTYLKWRSWPSEFQASSRAWVPVSCAGRVSWPDQQESLLSCTSIPARVGPSDWGHLSQEIWLLQFPSLLHYSSQKTHQKFFLNMPVKQGSIFVSVFEKFSKSWPSSNPEFCCSWMYLI